MLASRPWRIRGRLRRFYGSLLARRGVVSGESSASPVSPVGAPDGAAGLEPGIDRANACQPIAREGELAGGRMGFGWSPKFRQGGSNSASWVLMDRSETFRSSGHSSNLRSYSRLTASKREWGIELARARRPLSCDCNGAQSLSSGALAQASRTACKDAAAGMSASEAKKAGYQSGGTVRGRISRNCQSAPSLWKNRPIARIRLSPSKNCIMLLGIV